MKNLRVGDRIMTPKGVDFVRSIDQHWFSTRHWDNIPISHSGFRRLEIFEKLLIWFNCKVLKNHSWTSQAGEGKLPEEPPTEETFWKYAQLYCKNCDYHSKLNKHAEGKATSKEDEAAKSPAKSAGAK